MLKRLNGFKKFYLFSLVFLVIELLLVVFGLSLFRFSAVCGLTLCFSYYFAIFGPTFIKRVELNQFMLSHSFLVSFLLYFFGFFYTCPFPILKIL